MSNPSHDQTSRPTNRLARETSPYLRQHMYNPVDWHPWGQEAIEKARREDKPLLISIGYSACHWCHVMERESFENPDLASLVNATVIPVKVDREERPDVDAIYMNACVTMTGQGGWPLNAFVTPDLKPFFVGTYFPPDSRYGRPGFRQVLERIREAWLTEREQLRSQAALLHSELERYAAAGRTTAIDPNIFEKLVNTSANHFDIREGGFGGAPKFPPDMRLAALLAAQHDLKSDSALSMVIHTLEAMAAGGIYDHLGGGFARYSVDAEWLVPHFEKMLYNQALLVPVYLDAHLVTGRHDFARVAAETLDWVLRDMTDPGGMFQCAYDADSEGEEGKFYVWTPDQVAAVLGAHDAAFFNEFYGITAHGNFEHGTSILHQSLPLDEFAARHETDPATAWERLTAMRQKLLAARANRVPPGLDDKCLVGWNGLMITALSRGYQVLGDSKYLEAARTAAAFILSRMRRQDGRLLRCWCKEETRIDAMLDDYAGFINGLVDLYESSFDWTLASAARELCEQMIELFCSPKDQAFYFTADGDSTLISRTREFHDGATPAAPSLAVLCLVRLGRLFGEQRYLDLAAKSFAVAGERVNAAAFAHPTMLLAWRFANEPTPEIVIAGPASDSIAPLVSTVYQTYLPARLIASPPADNPEALSLPLFQDKSSERPMAFVCHSYTCKQPVSTPEELITQLETATALS